MTRKDSPPPPAPPPRKPRTRTQRLRCFLTNGDTERLLSRRRRSSSSNSSCREIQINALLAFPMKSIARVKRFKVPVAFGVAPSRRTWGGAGWRRARWVFCRASVPASGGPSPEGWRGAQRGRAIAERTPFRPACIHRRELNAKLFTHPHTDV